MDRMAEGSRERLEKAGLISGQISMHDKRSCILLMRLLFDVLYMLYSVTSRMAAMALSERG